jgi:hypothetical protein
VEGNTINTLEELKKIAYARGGECLSDKYINDRTKLKWRCQHGHIWETQPRAITHGHWCPICRNNKRKLNINDMRNLADKYNGKCLSNEYIDSMTKLKWMCENGHIWEAIPSSVKSGHWCIICAGKNKHTIKDMQNLSKKYDGECLSKEYINAITKLEWKCKDEHIFKARPNDVQNGHWCPICSRKKKLTLEDMQILAKNNNGKCLSTEYKNNRIKLKWLCKEGHVFLMRPNNVQQGQWCPKCVHYKSEETCREVFEKLFGKKFPKVRPKWLRNPETGRCLELDGYCEELGIAFEHNGRQHYEKNDLFHATEKEFRKTEERDTVKQILCKQHGVKLITVPQLKVKISGQFYLTKDNLRQYILRRLTIKELETYFKRGDMPMLNRTIESKKGPIKLPCLTVQIVDIDQVQANNYNPNAVADNNMKLLEESIMANGFCFPVVTVWDPDQEKYIIVDGFHRYLIFRDYLEAKQLPIIVLEHDISQRMAATVQFNRARGVHQVELMGDLVQALVQQGVDDADIAQRLGMEDEEVYRLKQITGIAELFKNQLYSRAWEMQEVADNS